MLIKRKSFDRQQYTDLLSAIESGGYRFSFFYEKTGGKTIYLRHDVDKDPGWAAEMAQIEYHLGVKSSFFFLLRSGTYAFLEHKNLEIIQQIHDLGHYVGLHFYFDHVFDEKKIDESVCKDIEIFQSIFKTKTPNVISFHNPTKILINRTPKNGQYFSTYEQRFLRPECAYISDSNSKFKERDIVSKLSNGWYKKIQLLIHPVWWMHNRPKNAVEILSHLFDKKTKELDLYLCKSNAIWKQNKGK